MDVAPPPKKSENKLWNMWISVVPIIISVGKDPPKRLVNQEYYQTITLLKTGRILIAF